MKIRKSTLVLGLGIGLLPFIAIASHYDTLKAEKVKQKLVKEKPDAKKIDILKATAPCYWKTALTSVAIGGILGFSGYLNAKELASVAATATAIATQFNKYKEVNEELHGPIDEAEMFSRVNSDHKYKTAEIDGDEDILWHEVYADKWFRMKKKDLDNAEFTIQEIYEDGGRIPYNMLLRAYGLKNKPGYFGESHGWSKSYDDFYNHPYIPIVHVERVDPVKGQYFDIVYPIPPYDFFHHRNSKPPFDED